MVYAASISHEFDRKITMQMEFTLRIAKRNGSKLLRYGYSHTSGMKYKSVFRSTEEQLKVD